MSWLTNVLTSIEVDIDASRAVVGDRVIEAEHPRDFRPHLTRAVYDVLHAGRSELAARPRTLRDADLDRRYAAALPHRETRIEVPVHEQSGHRLLVTRDGVRTWVDGAAEGDTATIPVSPARPALSPGFFLVDGSAGRSRAKPLLRTYVHLEDAEHAPEIWAAVLECLERKGIGYRAKVSSAPMLFPRRDGIVVYLGREFWDAAPAIADAVAGRTGVGPATSAFAHQLAPGVAIAVDPVDPRPGMRGLSFGEHRAAAVVAGLLDDLPGPAADRVTATLTAANIDSFNPARNLDSPAFPGMR
jgi:type III HopA1-like effector protein